MIDVDVKQVEGIKYLALTGKIDMANAGECEELMKTNMIDTGRLVVDLSGISFIDSTGVGSLVSAIKTAFAQGVEFEIVNVPDDINEIFEVIGVYEIIESLRSNQEIYS